jgi:putative transposase
MDRYRVTRGDGAAYLCTLTIHHWLPVFNAGTHYAGVILQSLEFMRRSKGLRLHAYVVMIDHLHLIACHDDLSGAMRDLKSWTALRLIEELHRDGRTRWLRLMEVGKDVCEKERGQQFRVWEDGFHPKVITSDAMFLQKLDYVHGNPVRKGFVSQPEDWRWSSAGNYLQQPGCALEIDPIGPLIA